MKKIIPAILTAAVALSCATGCRTNRAGLVILHTNDTHSHIEPERSGEKRGHGGVIERAAFVDSVRKAEGKNRVLLVHAGDFNQGTSYFTKLGGRLEAEVVNAMGYDCITLGNHEFDNGLEDLAARLATINCHVVCANMDLSDNALGQYVKPYAIIRKNRLKTGIIGLGAEDASTMKKATASRIKFLDSAEEVNRWALYLKNTEKCDLILVLSHLGYERDQEIAAASRNIDLIIGGHTHSFVDGMKYIADLDGKNVGIITDGCWGLEMGKITVL